MYSVSRLRMFIETLKSAVHPRGENVVFSLRMYNGKFSCRSAFRLLVKLIRGLQNQDPLLSNEGVCSEGF